MVFRGDNYQHSFLMVLQIVSAGCQGKGGVRIGCACMQGDGPLGSPFAFYHTLYISINYYPLSSSPPHPAPQTHMQMHQVWCRWVGVINQLLLLVLVLHACLHVCLTAVLPALLHASNHQLITPDADGCSCAYCSGVECTCCKTRSGQVAATTACGAFLQTYTCCGHNQGQLALIESLDSAACSIAQSLHPD